MEQLVQFRLLIDTLSQSEYEILIKSINKDDVVHALFDYHLKQLRKNESHKIRDINNKICEIKNACHNSYADATKNTSLLLSPQLNNIPTPLIHARKSQTLNASKLDEDTIHISNLIKLDDIVPELISKMASFLKRKEYNNLQITNRRCYIGCQSPFSLQELDFEHSPQDAKFLQPKMVRNLKSLRVHTHAFNHKSHFVNLKKLILCETRDDQSIALFSNNNCIDFSNLEYLQMEFIGDYDNDNEREIPISAPIFLEFLSKFPNLKYLNFYNDFYIDNNWDKKNIPFLPKLIAFACVDHDKNGFLAAIVAKHATQITSIRWNSMEAIPSNLVFPKATELMIGSMYGLDTYLNGFRNLDTISISVHGATIAKLLQKVLKTQNAIKFIEIRNGQFMEGWIKILPAINREISNLSVKRDQAHPLHFRISLIGYKQNAQHLMEKFIESGKKLIGTMSSVIDDYMVDIRLSSYANVFSFDTLQKILKEWSHQKDVVVYHHINERMSYFDAETEHDLHLVVSNRRYLAQRAFKAGGVYID
eukprot:186759_1